MSTEQTPLLVLTTSSKLQESLVKILEPEYSCEFAKSMDQAEKILQSKPINAALIDFQAATDYSAIEELNKIDSSLTHIIVCPRDKRESLLETDLSAKAFRVLFAPLSSGQTQLAVQSAVKYGSTHISEQQVRKTKGSNKMLPALISIGILAALASIYFLTRSEPEVPLTSETQRTEPVVQLTLAQENSIRELMTQARNAEELGNLFPPTENNAATAYLEILKLNEHDSSAQERLDELAKLALGDLELHLGNASVEDATLAITNANTLAAEAGDFSTYIENALNEQKTAFIQTAQTALSDGRIADALTSIETAKSVYIDDSDVNTAYDAIISEKENFDRSEEVNTLIDNARAAMLDNRLLTPTNRNARYYINSLETLDPENPSLRLLKSELGSALLIESRAETLNNNFTSAKRLIESARSLGSNPALVNSELNKITALESNFRQVEQARIQREQRVRDEQARLERERQQAQLAAAESSASTTPAETSANTADTQNQGTQITPPEQTAAIDEPVSQPPETETAVKPLPPVELNEPLELRFRDLSIMSQVQAKYPPRYLRNSTTGSVELTFTVDRFGNTQDVVATKITPARAREFGPSAVDAVEQWKFRPYMDENGNPRIVNTTVELNFEL